jgi:hypothetical protein
VNGTDLASTVIAECTENTALAASDADIFIPSLLIKPILLEALVPRANDVATCSIKLFVVAETIHLCLARIKYYEVQLSSTATHTALAITW